MRMCMKGDEEVQYGSSDGDQSYQWWRSSATPEEMSILLNLKGTSIADVALLTPRVRVMRELERLSMVAPEGLDDLRHRLVAYRAGDLWVPTGGLAKEDMAVSPVVSVLLVGGTGGGKSALVNLMYSVLGRAGIISFAQTSGSSTKSEPTTMFLEEHNILRSKRSGFCVYDSRGFDFDTNDFQGSDVLDELSKWMVDGVQHNQPCLRTGDEYLNRQHITMMMSGSSSSNKFLKREVNCAVVVANMAQIYEGLMAGDSKSLEATKHVLCFQALKKGNQNPILILTHGDKLSSDNRIDARLKICNFLGISETSGAYDIVCLTEHGVVAEECDPVTAYALTEAIYRVLLISDMSYLPRQNYKDKAMMLLSWFLSLLAAFFAFIARFFSGLSQTQRHYKRLD